MTTIRPPGVEQRGTVAQQRLETFHLAINRDAQRLEGARRRMHSAAAMRLR